MTMRALSAVFSSALLLIAMVSPPTHADESFYDIPAPGKLVDVGGYRLHINCQGYGSPTVILDAGLGDWSTHWTAVQNLLRGTTRVCSYDRAGYGWSDPGPRPRDSKRIVTELHMLLEKAAIEPPYLLAGHSFGGMNMRLYASTYPAEVAGLVLVDSSHPDSLPYERNELGTAPADERSNQLILSYYVEPEERNFPVEAQPSMHDNLLRTKSRVTSRREYRSLGSSVRQVLETPSLGGLPLAVISRGKRQWPAGAEGDLKEAAWQRQQRDLAGLSTLSHTVIASRSGHHIHLDQPELVAAVVREMVVEERQEYAAMTRNW